MKKILPLISVIFLLFNAVYSGKAQHYDVAYMRIHEGVNALSSSGGFISIAYPDREMELIELRRPYPIREAVPHNTELIQKAYQKMFDAGYYVYEYNVTAPAESFFGLTSVIFLRARVPVLPAVEEEAATEENDEK